MKSRLRRFTSSCSLRNSSGTSGRFTVVCIFFASVYDEPHFVVQNLLNCLFSMTSFFRAGDVADPIYQKLRDGTDEPHEDGRGYLERIWQECAPFVDPDAPDKATHDLASVFWELHLAHALRFAGKDLVPRNRLGYKNNKGPDLFAAEPDVWLEAVVVRPGTGADALDTELEFGKVYDYNPDHLVLRLRSVIRDKSAKLESYIADGIVKPGQATVIAISGVALPWRYKYSGGYPPEVVRAVYPANHQVIEIDKRTLARTDRYLERRESIRKARGASVSTDVFLDPAFAHVSALLYDESCWVGQSKHHPGVDLKVVHNPNAATPLLGGWYPDGDEYWWREGDSIERRRNGPDRTARATAARLAR